jgi:hypothetical protein
MQRLAKPQNGHKIGVLDDGQMLGHGLARIMTILAAIRRAFGRPALA